MKKYILTDEKFIVNEGGPTLYRIKRLSDGKLGGWIESEANLSQEGDCWVGDEACVWDCAKVRALRHVKPNDNPITKRKL